MIDNKILIFCDYPVVENAGGPVGYYSKCIHKNIPNNVVLLNDLLIRKKISFLKKIKLHYDRLFISKKAKHFPHKNAANKFIKVNANDYKFIYFHDIYTLNNVLHLLNKNH